MAPCRCNALKVALRSSAESCSEQHRGVNEHNWMISFQQTQSLNKNGAAVVSQNLLYRPPAWTGRKKEIIRMNHIFDNRVHTSVSVGSFRV